LSADPRKPDTEDGTSIPDREAAIEPAGGRRRLVETRCGLAEMARKEADTAAQRVVEAKRLYDEELAALSSAKAVIELAETHEAKDAAHRDFRAAVAAARNRRQVEAAATVWLNEINRINGQGRVARAHIRRERETVDLLLTRLIRLSDLAEASAVMATAATQACIAARAALDAADPDEATVAVEVRAGASSAEDLAVAAPPVEPPPVEPPPVEPPPVEPPPVEPPSVQPPSAEPPAGESPPATDGLVVDIRASEPQMITRLMRREGRTLSILVDRLAGNEPAARSGWQLLLSNFVDSVAAAAIDEGFLEFPKESPFWDQFSRAEIREVARGLTALGFRYDGFGAFADGRVPTRRDLAVAVGAAGLLPVRIRHWPTPDEAALLFRGVSASADAFIAVKAPALTLGEMVKLLGRRAEPLADLWNDWARVRPLLFSTTV
jgi:hypothetical protein